MIWSNKKHKTHTFIFGTQGNYQQNSNDPKAEEILLNNLSTNNQGIFGMVYSKFTKKLNTQAGIRLDRNQFLIPKNTTINEDLELNYQSINYSAGISYTSSKHSYRFNISSGYRPPHPIESLADGIHHASRKYEIGDINLKPEYANQIDFSYEYNNEHFDVNFNPYFSAISNYTFLSFSDSTINGYQVYNYKQNKQAFLYGTEINLHYHPHFLHNLHLETNLSYLFAENQNKKNIANIPQPKINSTITYNFHSKSKLLPKLIAIQHTYFGAQNRVVENEISSVDYQLLDIGINWKIDVKQIKGSFKLGTKNIFNKKYINHLSELKILGIPNPGRNFYITLKLNFNSKINKNEKTN
mgnify:CR=1 FL=1